MSNTIAADKETIAIYLTGAATVGKFKVSLSAALYSGSAGDDGSAALPGGNGSIDNSLKENTVLNGQVAVSGDLSVVLGGIELGGPTASDFPQGTLPEIAVESLTLRREFPGGALVKSSGASGVADSTGGFNVCLDAYVGQAKKSPSPNLQFLVGYEEASASAAESAATPTLVLLGSYTSPIDLQEISGGLPHVPAILKGLLAKLSITDLGAAYANQDVTDFAIPEITVAGDRGSPPMPVSKARTISLQDGFAFLATLHTPDSVVPLSLHLGSWTGDSSGHALLARTTDASSGSAPSKWFDVNKSFGPVHVSRIGLEYSEGAVRVLFDASLTVAALDLGLEGLYLGFKVEDLTQSVEEILNGIELGLSGLALSFKKPPIQISGTFVASTDTAGDPEYTGEALIELETLSIGAMGSYTDQGGHPSLFLFALLDTPLGGPPYFFVTGLAGGFGYNRTLELPDPDDILSFPLVEGAVHPPADPANLIAALNKDIQPDVGESWFAAGVAFTSFEMLDGFALITVEAGNELEFGLLGVLTLKVPQGSGKPIAEAQLALEAKLIPSAGIFSIAGGLTPNSFILSKSCRLVGGFAFDLWFGGNPHEGDFVLTFGGYNSAYHKPAWYPDEPRVGFDWVVGSVTIKGGSYFALTPHAVMAGGGLSIVYASGPVRAWLTIYADFLIEWKPFHYEIDAGVSIGASAKVGFVTLKVEVGAKLKIWGPAFTGKAHIKWFVVSFTIRFGADQSDAAPPPLTWEEFQTSFLPQHRASSTKRVSVDAPTPAVSSKTAATKIRISCGIVTQRRKPSSTEVAYTVVNAHELRIVTECSIPSTAIQLPSGSVKIPADTTTELSARPMLDPKLRLASTHEIKISGGSSPTIEIRQIHRRGLPSALWGIPKSATAPPPLNPGTGRVVKNVITGTELQIPEAPRPGGAVGPLPTKILESQAPVEKSLFWGGFQSFGPYANFPQGGQKIDKTIKTTIGACDTIRSQVVEQLQAAGVAVAAPDPLAGSDWSTEPGNLLFDPPVLSYLGDLPPNFPSTAEQPS